MVQKREISFIIPCYNENPKVLQETIKDLIKSLEKVSNLIYEIIVVNDGSTKFKYNKINLNNVKIVEHKFNKGYGAALKTGILNSRYNYIAISDADGTYPVAKYNDMIKELEDFDMIVGARSWSSISKLRLVPKYILTMFSSFLAGRKIEDLNSGMRIFKKDMSKQFWNLYPNGFSFTSTITMGAFTNGYEVKYIPIDYYKRDGKSHIHPIKDTIRFFTLVSRLTLYFNPLRFFMPLSFIFLLMAILRGIRDYIVTNSLGGLTLVLFFMSFQVFFFGLLAEIIRRK